MAHSTRTADGGRSASRASTCWPCLQLHDPYRTQTGTVPGDGHALVGWKSHPLPTPLRESRMRLRASPGSLDSSRERGLQQVGLSMMRIVARPLFQLWCSAQSRGPGGDCRGLIQANVFSTIHRFGSTSKTGNVRWLDDLQTPGTGTPHGQRHLAPAVSAIREDCVR